MIKEDVNIYQFWRDNLIWLIENIELKVCYTHKNSGKLQARLSQILASYFAECLEWNSDYNYCK